MKLKFKNDTELEVIEAGKYGGSNVNNFFKGYIIDVTVINPEEETHDHFDLKLSDGRKIIGVAKNLFTKIKEKVVKEKVVKKKAKSNVVKMRTSFIFRGRDGDMNDDIDMVVDYNIAIVTYDQETATKHAKALGKKLGIELVQTFPVGTDLPRY